MVEIAARYGLTPGRVSTICRAELSEAEQREVLRRTRRKERTALRVERTCEWCGNSFERTEAEIRAGKGRFCGLPCLWAWLWGEDNAEQRRGAAHAALRQLRVASAAERQRRGLLYVEEFVMLLPARLRRSRPALIRHMSRGGLVPDAQDEAGRALFLKRQLPRYRTWLENHPDARALRYNDDGDWTDSWSQAHHGSKQGAVRGRYNASPKPGKRPGPRVQLARDEESLVRRLLLSGELTQEQIAEKVGVSRKQVRGVLSRLRGG